MPYRPHRFVTTARELATRWVNIKRRAWIDHYVKTVYGSRQGKRKYEMAKRICFNSFTAFAHVTHLKPKEAAPIFGKLATFGKLNWADKAVALTRKAETGYLFKNEAVGSKKKEVCPTGPFSSCDDSIPVDVYELSALLCKSREKPPCHFPIFTTGVIYYEHSHLPHPMNCVTHDWSCFFTLWPDIIQFGHIASDVFRGMGVTQFIGIGHVDINGQCLILYFVALFRRFNFSPLTIFQRSGVSHIICSCYELINLIIR